MKYALVSELRTLWYQVEGYLVNQLRDFIQGKTVGVSPIASS